MLFAMLRATHERQCSTCGVGKQNMPTWMLRARVCAWLHGCRLHASCDTAAGSSDAKRCASVLDLPGRSRCAEYCVAAHFSVVPPLSEDELLSAGVDAQR